MADKTIEIVAAPVELTDAELKEITGGKADVVPACASAVCAVPCEEA
jgi:bacteriocin-like protein